jgi:hypothetical protein
MRHNTILKRNSYSHGGHFFTASKDHVIRDKTPCDDLTALRHRGFTPRPAIQWFRRRKKAMSDWLPQTVAVWIGVAT